MIYVRDRLVGHLSEMEKINSNTERYSLCKTLVRKHGTIADEALELEKRKYDPNSKEDS